jgi:hypothetical protein
MSMIPVADDPGCASRWGARRSRSSLPKGCRGGVPAVEQRGFDPAIAAQLGAVHAGGRLHGAARHQGHAVFRQSRRPLCGLEQRAETDAIKRQIDQEEADRKLLQSAGGLGVVASMVAGSLDPTMLLPGRVAIGLAKEGVAFVRGARRSAPRWRCSRRRRKRSCMRASRPARLGESLMNIGSATLLGALLGGTAVSLLAREGVLERTTAALDRDRAAISAHANPVTG